MKAKRTAKYAVTMPYADASTRGGTNGPGRRTNDAASAYVLATRSASRVGDSASTMLCTFSSPCRFTAATGSGVSSPNNR